MFKPSLEVTSGCPAAFRTPGNRDASVLTQSRKPLPAFGKVNGSLPDGLATPNTRSATMCPSSWPGNQTSRMAGPAGPSSAGSTATPALSLRTSAVLPAIDFPVVDVAARMPLIIATVLLLPGAFDVVVDSALGRAT